MGYGSNEFNKFNLQSPTVLLPNFFTSPLTRMMSGAREEASSGSTPPGRLAASAAPSSPAIADVASWRELLLPLRQ
jgi:hypothetical protein